MRAVGLKPCKFPSKTDNHPRRGYVNWWEAEYCKRRPKGLVRRFEIMFSINEEWPRL